MYTKKTLKIYGVLDKESIELEGFWFDANVMATITQIGHNDPEVEIEYVKDVFVTVDSSGNSVPIDFDRLKNTNEDLYDSFFTCLEQSAMRQALATPDHNWDHDQNEEM